MAARGTRPRRHTPAWRHWTSTCINHKGCSPLPPERHDGTQLHNLQTRPRKAKQHRKFTAQQATAEQRERSEAR
eukprot:15474445-Alexandrium_andersonii.AAC.1